MYGVFDLDIGELLVRIVTEYPVQRPGQMLNQIKQVSCRVLHSAAARFMPRVIDVAVGRAERGEMLACRDGHLM